MSLPSQPVCVITGGASGLGRALAVELAGRGARIVIGDLEGADFDGAVADVLAAGGDARGRVCDVRDAEAVEALVAFAEDTFGPLDLMVNNAGVAVGGPVGEVPLEDWRWVTDINLFGVIHGCHAAASRMKARGTGAILNVSSAAGLLCPGEMGPYNVAKAGVIALSETLAAELPDGIAVTVLCPTFFRTNLLDSARAMDARKLKGVSKLMDKSKMQAPEVAKAALAALEAGRLYAVPMFDGRLAWRLKRLAPAKLPWLIQNVLQRVVR